MSAPTELPDDTDPDLGDLPDDLRPPVGFEFVGVIGKGGMGAVIRARETAFDREVAVKVLLGDAPDPHLAVRFVDEARITGQLQHPGIPAAYRTGFLSDGRPFLAMKLIKGRTLDALVAEQGPGAARWLGAFEGICQAVGYAHAHGVIHRDLKPANVMVGGFGEVQVMDWGLAKVLANADTVGSPGSAPNDPLLTHVASLRDGTRAGSVMGTPAYMPPEQASGRVVGPAADVFGLGGILCFLLTGRPPYLGIDARTTLDMAAKGELADAFARLDGCREEPELIALCKRCLAVNPADRPATGAEVAAAVAGFRAAAAERARRAELDRATVEVEQRAARKRRRVIGWAAGVALALLTAGVVGTTIGLVRARAAEADAVAAQKEEERQRIEADRRKTEADAARVAAQAAGVEADRRQREAVAMLAFFNGKVFAAAGPKGEDGGLGKDVTLRDAIVASLPALETAFADQPLVEAQMRQMLGSSFNNLGEFDLARQQWERARTLAQIHIGPETEAVIGVSLNLANVYAKIGREPDAVSLREWCVATARKVLPADHPEALRARSSLAASYNAAGRHEDALTLWRDTLADQRRALPKDHPHTLASMTNVSLALRGLKRDREAADVLEEAVAAFERALPADHPDTLTTKYNLSNVYFDLNRREDALRLRQEVLAGERRVLPADHPKLLHGLLAVAHSLVNMDRGAEALPLIDECVPHVVKRGDDYLLHGAFTLRREHCERAKDAAEMRRTAEKWEALGRTRQDDWVIAAFLRGNSAGLAGAGGTEDADRAMAHLRKAFAAGFRDADTLRRRVEFVPLRGREDFQKLVAEVEAALAGRELLPPPRLVE